MKHSAFGTLRIHRTSHVRSLHSRVWRSVLAPLLAGIVSVGILGAGDLDSWVMTLPNYVGMGSIAAGPDRILIVGDSGTVVISEDSQSWTSRNLEADVTVMDATFGNGKFVCLTRALASPGNLEPALLHSADGIAWTRTRPPVPRGRIRFAGTQFFALGEHGSIHSSPDGVEWTLRYSGQSDSVLSDIVHGGDLFIAVGRQGFDWNALVLTSPDGIEWSLAPQPPTDSHNSGHRAAYGNGVFVVAAGCDSYALHGGRYWWSTDGFHWETRYLPGREVLNSVAFGNGTFVIVASNGRVFVSTDGEMWDAVASGQDDHLDEIVHTSSGFLALARHGSAELIQSPDGRTWGKWNYSKGLSLNPYRIMFTHDLFVAVGESVGTKGGGPILLSPDGKTWSAAEVPDDSTFLTGLAHGQNRFVAVGFQSILTSVDGQTWQPAAKETPHVLYSVACDESTFVAVGGSGDGPGAVMLRSTDGEVWEPAADVSDLPFMYAVARGHDQFVALASNLALTSPDGLSWARHPFAESREMMNVTFANGLYVAVGKRAIRTSTDGINWTIQIDHRFPDFYGIHWDGGRWIASGRGENWTGTSTLWTSADGQTWVPQIWTRPLHTVAFGNGTYVAGGIYLYQSLPMIPQVQVERLNQGQLSIRLDATPQTQITLERSTDLLRWTPWIDLVPTGSSVSLIDHNLNTQQFYRARQNSAP